MRCFASKPQRLKGQILHFLTPCVKIREGLAKFLSRYLAGVRMWVTRRYGYTRTALKRHSCETKA